MGHLALSESIVHDSNDNKERDIKIKKYPNTNIESVDFLECLKDRISKKTCSMISKVQTKKYKELQRLLDGFAFLKVCHVLFVDMKWVPVVGEEFTIKQFIEKHKLLRSYKKLVLTLLRRLAEHGILIEKTGKMIFKVVKLPPHEITVLNEMKSIPKILLDNPEWSQEASCVEYIGSHLYSVISGKEAGHKIMFPSETDTLNYPYGAKSLYENSFVMKTTKVIPTTTGIEEYLHFLTNNNAITDKIRILEIGAGTGGTTIPLLESFSKETFDKLEYEITDISNFLLGQTEARIQSQFPENVTKCIGFKTLDISTEPKTQGFELGSYDILLAADVFHATEYLEDTVSHARSLLKPNGLLVLGEIFQSRMGIEVMFGLTSGWWNWSDKIRTHSSPLLNPVEWNALLKNHGFINSFALGDDTYGVIFALANGSESSTLKMDL